MMSSSARNCNMGNTFFIVFVFAPSTQCILNVDWSLAS